MKHWVVDTNIIVSGLLTAAGPAAQVVDAIQDGRIKLVYDARILAEYRDVLQRPRLKLPPSKVRSFLDSLQNQWLVTPQPLGASGPDPDDVIFIEAALTTLEKTIVTGNLAHYPENLLQGARIMTPTQAAGELGNPNVGDSP